MSCAHLLRRRLCGTTPLLSSRSMLTTARAGTLQFDGVTHHALSTQASTAVDGVGVAGAASNIWVADVPVTKVKGLNTLHPYRRATRARFPNGDPELCTDCWHDNMKRWHPDLSCVGKARTVYMDLRVRNAIPPAFRELGDPEWGTARVRGTPAVSPLGSVASYRIYADVTILT